LTLGRTQHAPAPPAGGRILPRFLTSMWTDLPTAPLTCARTKRPVRTVSQRQRGKTHSGSSKPNVPPPYAPLGPRPSPPRGDGLPADRNRFVAGPTAAAPELIDAKELRKRYTAMDCGWERRERKIGHSGDPEISGSAKTKRAAVVTETWQNVYEDRRNGHLSSTTQPSPPQPTGF